MPIASALKTRYDKNVRDELKKQFSYDNVMRIPRVEKIQSQLYDLVENYHEAHTFGDEDREAIVRQVNKAKSKDDDKAEADG